MFVEYVSFFFFFFFFFYNGANRQADEMLTTRPGVSQHYARLPGQGSVIDAPHLFPFPVVEPVPLPRK